MLIRAFKIHEGFLAYRASGILAAESTEVGDRLDVKCEGKGGGPGHSWAPRLRCRIDRQL